MKIKHEKGQKDAWICICGNQTDYDGFYPCNSKGKLVEPDKNWNGIYYKCDRCGRVINQNTLEIIKN